MIYNIAAIIEELQDANLFDECISDVDLTALVDERCIENRELDKSG